MAVGSQGLEVLEKASLSSAGSFVPYTCPLLLFPLRVASNFMNGRPFSDLTSETYPTSSWS